VEEAICPELRDGLMKAMMWLRRWYYPQDRRLVRIEANVRTSVSKGAREERMGLFFSGGVDSLSVLRWNRLHIPLEHPASIKDGVLIFGIQNENAQMRRDIEDQLSVIAEEARVTLIPISTNLVEAFNEMVHWEHEWEGAALAAVAHALTGRLTQAVIASTNDISTMMPLGTHPVLDPNYSSSDLRIRHEGITLSRFVKTKLIAEWDTALQNLRVCNQIPYGKKTEQGTLNCGKCEKCIRTMIALVALGALDRTRAFPCADVSPDLVGTVPYFNDIIRYRYYVDVIEPLRAKRREDLVRAIEALIKRSRPREVVGIFQMKLSEVDRRYLGGWLGKAKRFAGSAVRPTTAKSNDVIDSIPLPLTSQRAKTK
jgi:hypothetical protein